MGRKVPMMVMDSQYTAPTMSQKLQQLKFNKFISEFDKGQKMIRLFNEDKQKHLEEIQEIINHLKEIRFTDRLVLYRRATIERYGENHFNTFMKLFDPDNTETMYLM